VTVRARTGLAGRPVNRRARVELGAKTPRTTRSNPTAAANAKAFQTLTVATSTQKRKMATQTTAIP
jgi:hypothetical protein